MATAKVILFKKSGKYYTSEEWRIPAGAIGPYDMINSSDFHRIGNGDVLVESQEPWGFPAILTIGTHLNEEANLDVRIGENGTESMVIWRGEILPASEVIVHAHAVEVTKITVTFPYQVVNLTNAENKSNKSKFPGLAE